MDVLTYYKAHLYDYAYNIGYEHKENNFGTMFVRDNVDYTSFDYKIISDYIKLYEPTEDDWGGLIKVLGFTKEDFENEE